MQSIVADLNELLEQVTSPSFTENSLISEATSIHTHLASLCDFRDSSLLCQSMSPLLSELSTYLRQFESRDFTIIDLLSDCSSALTDLHAIMCELRYGIPDPLVASLLSALSMHGRHIGSLQCTLSRTLLSSASFPRSLRVLTRFGSLSTLSRSYSPPVLSQTTGAFS
jgi:hypothetical protein